MYSTGGRCVGEKLCRHQFTSVNMVIILLFSPMSTYIIALAKCRAWEMALTLASKSISSCVYTRMQLLLADVSLVAYGVRPQK